MSQHKNSILFSRSLLYIALGTVAILMVPLITMQFTTEVNWRLSDFIVIGVLLFGTGLAYVLVSRNVQSRRAQICIAIILTILMLWVWAELAVGIFTNWGS